MREPLTSEEVLEMGKMWGDSLFSVVPAEEVINHYKPEEAFSHYTDLFTQVLSGSKVK